VGGNIGKLPAFDGYPENDLHLTNWIIPKLTRDIDFVVQAQSDLIDI